MVHQDSYSEKDIRSEWKTRFKNIDVVKQWMKPKRLQWLRIKSIGRAQKNTRRVAVQSFVDVIKALHECFEPKISRACNQAEIHDRQKKRLEGLAEYSEELNELGDT